MPYDFVVDRADLTRTQLRETTAVEAGPGEVVLAIERFALTANNITYGVAGDMIGYWKFFPAADEWGRIPVWGIASVTVSNHPDIQTGTRYYGYFPMSSAVCVKPEKVSANGFTDGAAHRAELPVVYNQYATVSSANGFDPAYDNHAMVYRPLFTTSYVLDDFFADNDFFGAKQIILGSASSKTAFGMAFMLKRRAGLTVVGLTSNANQAFVESLGLYDDVYTYDAVESIPQVPSAYVDMAGNRSVLARVHHHLTDQLVNSCGVGITHWDARDGEAPASLPGAKPTMFFAPSQIVKRNKELGPAVYQQQLREATSAFLQAVDQWVQIEEHPFSDVASVFDTVRDGASPNRAYVVTAE